MPLKRLLGNPPFSPSIARVPRRGEKVALISYLTDVKRILLGLPVVAVIFLLLAGCGSGGGSSAGTTTSEETTASTAETTATGTGGGAAEVGLSPMNGSGASGSATFTDVARGSESISKYGACRTPTPVT
jgi:hypothetical protein